MQQWCTYIIQDKGLCRNISLELSADLNFTTFCDIEVLSTKLKEICQTFLDINKNCKTLRGKLKAASSDPL